MVVIDLAVIIVTSTVRRRHLRINREITMIVWRKSLLSQLKVKIDLFFGLENGLETILGTQMDDLKGI